MKLTSTPLSAILAICIALAPMQAASKMQSDEHGREAAKPWQSQAPSRTVVQRPVGKPQPQSRQVARQVPERAPSVQHFPQYSASKAPDRPRQIAAPERAPSVVRSAPQREVQRPSATAESRRPAPASRKPEIRPAQRPAAIAAGPSEAEELAGSRDISRSPQSQERRAQQAAPTSAEASRAAREAAMAQRRDVERLRSAPDIRTATESQQLRDARRSRDERAIQSERHGQNLSGATREGAVTRQTDQTRTVDLRPAPLNTPEARQQRQDRSQIREDVATQRQSRIAERLAQERPRVEQFRENRASRVAALGNARQTFRRSVATEISPQRLTENRGVIRDFWRDRAADVRYRVAGRRDYLFNDDWWDRCHWRGRHVHVSHPWWWWQPAYWNTVSVFLDAGWSDPIYYDYGADVICDDRAVYVHGVDVGTPIDYSREVIAQANPPVEAVAEAPVEEAAWTPLGVWALVQENQGDAVMFFQLSVNKEGIISGAYSNVVSGESQPIVGRVNRETQRAAWHIGVRTDKVFEAGMANLTQDQASCLVHLAPGEMQTWLLVRLENPEMPSQPANLQPTGSNTSL